MKKGLLLTLGILLLCALLMACSPSDPQDIAPPDTSDPSQQPQSTHFLQQYTLVCGNTVGGVVTEAADLLTDALQDTLGVTATRTTDLSPAATYELLLGRSDRPEAQRALQSLPDDGYTIRRDGNHIVILGATDALTLHAATVFIDEILPTLKEADQMEQNFAHNATAQLSYTAIYDGERKTPALIKTVYDTTDTVIAKDILTEKDGVDPTGQRDSSDAIQKMLNACAKSGGGTIFLPAGKYLVTKTITIPAGCILRGDWQDPLTTDTPAYGTVILAKPAPLNGATATASNALIVVGNNAGAIGLTFYYPEQSATAPLDYGFTLYAGSYDTMTMQNLTLLNAYRGIGLSVNAEVHEFSQIESVRICALSVGMHMLCSPDVGNQTDILISPDLWANAAEEYRCDDAQALRTYLQSNAVGMILGDLDDEQFAAITIDGYHTGIRFVKQTVTRPSSFWGMFYDLTIKDAVRGIEAEYLFSRAGAIFASSRIEGSEYAIYNACPDGGSIKLCDVVVDGECFGRVLEDDSTPTKQTLHKAAYQKPAPYLYVASISTMSKTSKDASAKIQEALDAAASTGGIVYLPTGFYTLKQPLHIPANVELRGGTPIYTRDGRKFPGESVGTVLLCYYTKNAMITLDAGAGVNGVRLWFPQNDPELAYKLLGKNDAIRTKNIAILGTGAGVYAVNTTINAAFVGVDFTACDRHVIDRLYGCCYDNFIIAGGEGGSITSCLSNMHFLELPDTAVLSVFDKSNCNAAAWKTVYTNGFNFIRDTLLCEYCDFITLRDAKDEVIQNVFMYAAHHFLNAENASVTMFNVSVDALYRDYPMLHAQNSTLYAVNLLRIGGTSYQGENSTVKLYNRCSFCNMGEVPYDSDIHATDPATDLNYSDTQVLASCDDIRNVNGCRLETDPDFVKEGDGSWYHETNPDDPVILRYRFPETDISDYVEDGYLHLWIWVEDYSTFITGGGEIELTSSGDCDRNEACWDIYQFIKHEGWNEVFLPLNSAQFTNGQPNYKAVNFIRIYAIGNACDIYVDDIFVCK